MIQNKTLGMFKYEELLVWLDFDNSNCIEFHGFLANTSATEKKLKKILGNFNIEIFNFEKTYIELVFPIASGNYYNVPDMFIELDLSNKNSSYKINYQVNVWNITCGISFP